MTGKITRKSEMYEIKEKPKLPEKEPLKMKDIQLSENPKKELKKSPKKNS
ncbi:hypothetical protein [Methanosarcina horonobensis]|nr:hypothetical protein [Methanosarcina horonobensis]